MTGVAKKAIGSQGFRRILVGIMNENEQVTDVVTVDENSGGAIELKTSGFTGQLNVEYASNIAYFVSNAGTGTGKIELTVMELPDDFSTKVLGDTVNEDGVYMTTSDVKQPYVAIIAEAQDLNNKPMWVGVAKAKFATTDGDDLKTGEDKGMTPEKISVTGSAITRRNGKLVKTKATNANGTTLEQFAKVLFPGYTGSLDDSTQDDANAGSKTTDGEVTA